MSRCIGLSLALFFGTLLSFNACFADVKGLKYSMPPTCNNEGKVICGENEEVTCLVFDPDTSNIDKDIKYIPLQPCDGEPTCVIEGSDFPAPKNVEIGCVEYVDWKDDVAHCSEGKVPKCPGNNNELNGHNCEDGSDPICEYTWEISNVTSYR